MAQLAQKNTWVNRQITISGTRIKFYKGRGYELKYCTTRRSIPDEILLNNFSEITIDAGSKSRITLCFVEKTGYVYLLDNQVQRTISYTCKGDKPIVHTGDHYPNPSLKYTRANTIFFPKGVTTDYVEILSPKQFLACFHWVPIYIEPVTRKVYVTKSVYCKCKELKELLKKTYIKYPYPEKSCKPRYWAEYDEYMSAHPNHIVVSKDEYTRLTPGIGEITQPRDHIKFLSNSVLIPQHWTEYPGAYALDFNDESSLRTLITQVCLHAQEIKRKLLLKDL